MKLRTSPLEWRLIVGKQAIKLALTLLAVTVAMLGSCQRLTATLIDPLLWEQFAADADFIGIVDCSTAGGIVAKYRVRESWKGPPEGTELSIRLGVEYWGTQFPIALVGEKYLVAAFKSGQPVNMISTSSAGGVPLWWRRIPVTHYLPLWQGRVQLPLGNGERPLSSLGSGRRDLESFRADVRTFLSLPAEARESRMLSVLTRKLILGHKRAAISIYSDKPAWPSLAYQSLSGIIRRNPPACHARFERSSANTG
ncbi:MAG: hypothetical protein ABIG68_07235 [Acidobacteriota bacterium]